MVRRCFRVKKKKEVESETKQRRGPGETGPPFGRASGDRGGVCAWPIRVSIRTTTVDQIFSFISALHSTSEDTMLEGKGNVMQAYVVTHRDFATLTT
jgi:hypothetical protein